MFFRKKYRFLVNEEQSLVEQALKQAEDQPIPYKNSFGIESPYCIEKEYDQFVISRKSDSSYFYPGANLKLIPGSEMVTEIRIDIRLSTLLIVLLVFIHLGILGILFTPQLSIFGIDIEANWGNKILVMLLLMGIVNLIMWLVFITEISRLKEAIKLLFKQTGL